MAHAADDRFAERVDLGRGGLPIAHRRDLEGVGGVELVDDVAGDGVVGRAVRPVAVEDDEVLEALLDQRRADLEEHELIGRDRQRDGARKELERLRDAVGDRRGDQRAETLRKQPGDVLDLMGVGVGRHVRPVRLGGAGRQDHGPLRPDGLGDLHLGHARHAVFHGRLHCVGYSRCRRSGDLRRDGDAPGPRGAYDGPMGARRAVIPPHASRPARRRIAGDERLPRAADVSGTAAKSEVLCRPSRVWRRGILSAQSRVGNGEHSQRGEEADRADERRRDRTRIRVSRSAHFAKFCFCNSAYVARRTGGGRTRRSSPRRRAKALISFAMGARRRGRCRRRMR